MCEVDPGYWHRKVPEIQAADPRMQFRPPTYMHPNEKARPPLIP
jgi:hypothetical protein